MQSSQQTKKPYFRSSRNCPLSEPDSPPVDYKNVKLLQKYNTHNLIKNTKCKNITELSKHNYSYITKFTLDIHKTGFSFFSILQMKIKSFNRVGLLFG